MHRIILVISLSVCLSMFCEAQVTPLYPDVPTTIFFNKTLLGPAFVPESGKYSVAGIYKFQPGDPNLALYDLNAATIWGEETSNRQLIRLILSNEKEGPYISNPRAGLNYAYQLRLSEDSRLSAGLSLGFVSRVFNAPTSTGKGNLFLPDANMGLEFHYRKLETGIGIMQMLNAKATPFQSPQQARRYYQVYAAYSHELSAFLSLKEYALFRILPDVTRQLFGGLNLIYQNLYELGMVYYQRRGVAFQLVVDLEQMNFPLSISMAYNSPFLSESPVWVSSVELGLRTTLGGE